MKIDQTKIEDIIPYANNSRTHDETQWAYIGDYAVSRCGIIVALQVNYKNRWGGTSVRKSKVLAQSNDKDGYKLATLKRLGWNKNGQVRVHRLVAHCWIGPCPDGLEVNHIDGVKSNNNADNLEYVTSRQNKEHAVAMGLMKSGAEHRLTKQIVAFKDDCVLLMDGEADIKSFGFHAPSLRRVARGERETIHGWRAMYV